MTVAFPIVLCRCFPTKLVNFTLQCLDLMCVKCHIRVMFVNGLLILSNSLLAVVCFVAGKMMGSELVKQGVDFV